MRYCRFETTDGPQYGEVEGQDGKEFVTRLLTPPPEDNICALSSKQIKPVAIQDVKLLAPVLPSKIICVGATIAIMLANWGTRFQRKF
jgi:hypothetical protein